MEDIRGYVNKDIVRKSVGSPGVWYEFSNRTESVFIENLSTSNPLYFNLDGAADTGSTSGFLSAGENITIDYRAGSVNLMGSGTSTDNAQVIGLYN